jgi:hypothetical protein
MPTATQTTGKPRAGAAKKSFLQKCKKEACEPKAVDSSGKPLKGAAKKSFVTKCKKDAAKGIVSASLQQGAPRHTGSLLFHV